MAFSRPFRGAQVGTGRAPVLSRTRATGQQEASHAAKKTGEVQHAHVENDTARQERRPSRLAPLWIRLPPGGSTSSRSSGTACVCARFGFGVFFTLLAGRVILGLRPDTADSWGHMQRIVGELMRRLAALACVRTIPGMFIEREELDCRLAEADRVRAVLRLATREWQALGRKLLEERIDGPDRPDDCRPRRLTSI